MPSPERDPAGSEDDGTYSLTCAMCKEDFGAMYSPWQPRTENQMLVEQEGICYYCKNPPKSPSYTPVSPDPFRREMHPDDCAYKCGNCDRMYDKRLLDMQCLSHQDMDRWRRRGWCKDYSCKSKYLRAQTESMTARFDNQHDLVQIQVPAGFSIIANPVARLLRPETHTLKIYTTKDRVDFFEVCPDARSLILHFIADELPAMFSDPKLNEVKKDYDCSTSKCFLQFTCSRCIDMDADEPLENLVIKIHVQDCETYDPDDGKDDDDNWL